MLSNSASFASAHNSWWKSFSKMCNLIFKRQLKCHPLLEAEGASTLRFLSLLPLSACWVHFSGIYFENVPFYLSHIHTRHIHRLCPWGRPPKFLLISSFSVSDPNSYKVPCKFFFLRHKHNYFIITTWDKCVYSAHMWTRQSLDTILNH